MKKIALLVSLGLTLAFTGGCADSEDRGTATAAPSAVKAQSPADVLTLAGILNLGADQGGQGAAGHTYFDFEKGTIGFVNATSKVDSVKFHDESLDVLSHDAQLTGDVLKAVFLGVGPFQHTETAAGNVYFQFEGALVHEQNGPGELHVDRVTFTDATLGTLSGDPLAAALSLALGKYQGGQGGLGVTYYSFDRGSMRFSNQTGKLVDAFVADPSAVPGSGDDQIHVPGDVVMASVTASLGEFKSSQGGAGHLYYEFENGTVDYSNVEQKVLGVIPNPPTP